MMVVEVHETVSLRWDPVRSACSSSHADKLVHGIRRHDAAGGSNRGARRPAARLQARRSGSPCFTRFRAGGAGAFVRRGPRSGREGLELSQSCRCWKALESPSLRGFSVGQLRDDHAVGQRGPQPDRAETGRR